MARIRLIHWKSSEAEPLLERLRAAGHEVDYDEQIGPMLSRCLREQPPDVVVIDLTRLPSHGKSLGVYISTTRRTSNLPLIFHAGDPEKVASVQEKLPHALYVPTPARLIATLRQAPQAVAPSPVATHSIASPHRSSAQKLGITVGAKVSVVDPPAGYVRVLGPLPDGVEFGEDERPAHGLTLWFVHDAQEFEARLPEARRWAVRTKLWILWRKQTAGQAVLSQTRIRELAALFGLVDYKICSVDRTWSGMLFSLRK